MQLIPLDGLACEIAPSTETHGLVVEETRFGVRAETQLDAIARLFVVGRRVQGIVDGREAVVLGEDLLCGWGVRGEEGGESDHVVVVVVVVVTVVHDAA